MSDFIMLVENEIPMNTYNALQDSENIMIVMNSSSVVDNLSISVFLNASGKVITLSL